MNRVIDQQRTDAAYEYELFRCVKTVARIAELAGRDLKLGVDRLSRRCHVRQDLESIGLQTQLLKVRQHVSGIDNSE